VDVGRGSGQISKDVGNNRDQMSGLCLGRDIQVRQEQDRQTTFFVYNVQETIHAGDRKAGPRKAALPWVWKDHACLHEIRRVHPVQVLAISRLPDFHKVGPKKKGES
jgi:hypothetical protein